VLVVKIGGGAGLNLGECLTDLADIARQRPLVIVHGVSARMDALCAKLDHPVRTLTSPYGHSSRYTDARTRDIFVQAATEVNNEIVTALRVQGINAVGVEADPDFPITGRRKDAIRAVVDGRVRVVRDDYTGTITDVNADDLRTILANGGVVVLPPLAISDDGALNVDGDRLAAAVAAALGACDLVILSNVRGLLRDVRDANSLLTSISGTQIEGALTYAEGRMKRKVLGASEALNGGVQRVVIGDGRESMPVRRALDGAGTAFYR
jgi:acetylglutamate/LysW-gamma-L-alpha-aminoadipate kinase